MRRIVLLLMILPLFMVGQRTFIPDDNFEQVLINLNLDDIFDDSVNTANIDTVQILYISDEGIADLTGIEDFAGLTELFCNDNQLQSLDLSNNTNLFEVNCRDNQLTSLSLKNGNAMGLWYFTATGNPNLLCIEVDNVAFAYSNLQSGGWEIDPTAAFSTNCGPPPTSISERTNNRKVIKIMDSTGRETVKRSNTILFYLYDDGTVEKRIILE